MSALRGVGQRGQGPPLSIPTSLEISALAVVTTSACRPKTSVTTALRVPTATLMQRGRVAETTILSSKIMSCPGIIDSKRHGNHYCDNYVTISGSSLRIPSTMNRQSINHHSPNATANAAGPQNGSPSQRTSSTNWTVMVTRNTPTMDLLYFPENTFVSPVHSTRQILNGTESALCNMTFGESRMSPLTSCAIIGGHRTVRRAPGHLTR